MVQLRLLLVLAAAITAAAAYAGCDDASDGDGDADMDVDIDGDTDVDTDGDTDGDFDASPCPEAAGTASVSGTVGGEEVTATHAMGRWVQMGGAVSYSVALINEEGSCDDLADSARSVVVFVCGTAAGSYAVGEVCEMGSGVWFPSGVRLVRPSGNVDATGGTVTLEAYGSDCGDAVTGSFTADFDGEELSGSFDTINCGRQAP